MKRRQFLKGSAALTATTLGGLTLPRRLWGMPAPIASDHERPVLAQGLQIGDVTTHAAVLWTRSDRPARMLVEWDTSERFTQARRIRGPHCLPENDFTARVDLRNLPAGAPIFVRVLAQGLSNERTLSEPLHGRFRTASLTPAPVRMQWSGDTCGQGYGINPDLGGMRIYETMRLRDPDFFVHCGDTIYADAPLAKTLQVEQGRVWRNLVTPEKSKVAETLDEFRGNYRYNFLDENLRRFNAQVPQVWQWDDHETTGNWSSGLVLGTQYTVRDVPLLVARSTTAFLEYAPLRRQGDVESERIYRHIPRGPLLDVFVIDMRSYRGPNSYNRQPELGPDSRLLGRRQLQWLKHDLAHSRATWKIIAADLPIGLMINDGQDAQGRPRFENAANGSGPALGRELELAELLSFMKRSAIHNVVWVTAEVHYAAAHHYDPSRARFTDFDPFWEFVAAPLNAGSFGPAPLDDTFGPEVRFSATPAQQKSSPLDGHQHFGELQIDPKSGALTARLLDGTGALLFEQVVAPHSPQAGRPT